LSDFDKKLESDGAKSAQQTNDSGNKQRDKLLSNFNVGDL